MALRPMVCLQRASVDPNAENPDEWLVVERDGQTGQLHFYPAFVMHAEPWDPSKEPPPAASPPAP